MVINNRVGSRKHIAHRSSIEIIYHSVSSKEIIELRKTTLEVEKTDRSWIAIMPVASQTAVSSRRHRPFTQLKCRSQLQSRRLRPFSRRCFFVASSFFGPHHYRDGGGGLGPMRSLLHANQADVCNYPQGGQCIRGQSARPLRQNSSGAPPRVLMSLERRLINFFFCPSSSIKRNTILTFMGMQIMPWSC